MANKLFFALLFCTLHLTLTPVFAAHGSAPSENASLKNDLCDAPAPDSFRVTSIGSGYANLAWIPAWTGATHTLVVFLQDSSGGWTNLATYLSVPGSSYSIPVSAPGSYKVLNATNCTSGETSFRNSEVEFKLIDLTTAGRVPLNPTPVYNCNQIDYLNHKWVGFRVKEKASGLSNLFEFQVEGPTGLVKRVANNPIVAVDGNGIFPIGNQHLSVGFSFQMDDKSKEEPPIGFVEITQYYLGQSPTIGLCIDLDNPMQWKPAYEFTALTAQSVVTNVPPGGGTGNGLTRSNVDDKCTAQSPFTNNLTIFIPETLSESEEATLLLLNMNGDLVLKQKFDLGNTQASFFTESLFPGLYILQIESDHEMQALLVVKF